MLIVLGFVTSTAPTRKSNFASVRTTLLASGIGFPAGVAVDNLPDLIGLLDESKFKKTLSVNNFAELWSMEHCQRASYG